MNDKTPADRFRCSCPQVVEAGFGSMLSERTPYEPGDPLLLTFGGTPAFVESFKRINEAAYARLLETGRLGDTAEYVLQESKNNRGETVVNLLIHGQNDALDLLLSANREAMDHLSDYLGSEDLLDAFVRETTTKIGSATSFSPAAIIKRKIALNEGSPNIG